QPQTVATFALNRALYNLPDDYYDTYLERLSKITVEDIQQMAEKYIHPDKAIVFVVGNKSEVAPKLARFASSGKVEFYDVYGSPAIELEPAPEGMTAEQVIEGYLK